MRIVRLCVSKPIRIEQSNSESVQNDRKSAYRSLCQQTWQKSAFLVLTKRKAGSLDEIGETIVFLVQKSLENSLLWFVQISEIEFIPFCCSKVILLISECTFIILAWFAQKL